MKRLVAVFLIPMFMLGQPLPHSHAGATVDRPDDHAARPHVHLSQHGHGHGHAHGTNGTEADHHHHHGGEDDSSTPAADGTATIVGLDAHDDDAVYLTGVALSHDRLSRAEHPTPVAVVCGYLPERMADLARSAPRCWVPLRRCSGPPIYLLTASLRL